MSGSQRGVGVLARLASRSVLLPLALTGLSGQIGSNCPHPAQAEPSLPQQLAVLLRHFSELPGLSASFREERHLALLEAPLVSRGVLYFAPPDNILRRVEDPVPSAVLLRGSDLTIQGPDGVRSVDLAPYPVLRTLLDTFRGLLRGDLEALRSTYQIEWKAGKPPDWEIHLKPLRPPVSEAIASIRVAGRERTPRELRVLEVSGDETITDFFDVDAGRRFSAAELASLFGPQPP